MAAGCHAATLSPLRPLIVAAFRCFHYGFLRQDALRQLRHAFIDVSHDAAY
jgi:hypothetical protein